MSDETSGQTRSYIIQILCYTIVLIHIYVGLLLLDAYSFKINLIRPAFKSYAL